MGADTRRHTAKAAADGWGARKGFTTVHTRICICVYIISIVFVLKATIHVVQLNRYDFNVRNHENDGVQ